MTEYLKLMSEFESDELVTGVEALIVNFSDVIAPRAADLMGNLVCASYSGLMFLI